MENLGVRGKGNHAKERVGISTVGVQAGPP